MRISPGELIATLLYVLLWPALMLMIGGDWSWLAGWIFSGWFVVLCAWTIVWLYINEPALLTERYRRPGTGGQSRGDTLIVYCLAAGFLAWIVVMPLDARRFRWSPALPPWINIVGAALLLLSGHFLRRAFTDNPFVSALVRIQAERAHQVATTGVYAVVRHPMYLGALLMFAGAPLLTGSIAALGVGMGLSLLLAIRIVAEETLLAGELAGYEDYRRRVPYRLVPLVW